MAQPFIGRLILDNVNLKIIKENRQKIGGFRQFKSAFLSRIWDNVKTNWLMLVFCLPVIAWIVYSQIGQVTADTTIPYSAGLTPYPVVNDAHIVGAAMDFQLSMRRAVILLPLVVIASVGLAGVFNVAKYFCWGFQIKIAKTFFRGIKNSFAPFIWVGMMLGVCLILITFVFGIFNVYPSVHISLKILAYALSIIVTFFVLLLSMFVTTQASVLNLTLFEILKNSFHLGSKFLLQNSFILVAGLVSMVLPFLTFNLYLLFFVYTVFFMLAFSYTASVWTVYTQYIYELIFDGAESAKDAPVELKPQTAPAQHKTQQRPHQPKREETAKKPATPYKNPKKKKKK